MSDNTIKENKFKAILASDTFRSIASAVICALVGIIVGFIILLIINAEHAPKAISVILKNFLYYRNKGKKYHPAGLCDPNRFINRAVHFFRFIQVVHRAQNQRHIKRIIRKPAEIRCISLV